MDQKKKGCGTHIIKFCIASKKYCEHIAAYWYRMNIFGKFPNLFNKCQGTYAYVLFHFFCAQILLGGLELDQDNNVLLLDQELASMRSGRAFLSQINDNIPRTPSSMMQMASMLHSQRSRSLPPPQFDRVVLSLVYSLSTRRGSCSASARALHAPPLAS
uniref:Uncharacterized protein n=1 Tax=Takifugu rubripes TaxID=31033 RepID=A0A3B5K7P7_TAKRU